MILGSSGAVLLNIFMVCYLLCLLILLVPTPCSLTHTHVHFWKIIAWILQARNF
jgi:hypothetical protein